MKLKFKHQKFQADAAKAIVDVFNSQPYQSGMSYLIDKGKTDSKQQELGEDFIGFKNAKISLDDNRILENIQTIQRNNLIKPSECLEGKYNLTVEMETGVGKTYTYIKTIFELHKAYGWSKFIVIVPSIAIREGVYKSFQITQDHFMEEYGEKIRFFIYNSAHLNQIDQFASDNKINVMIINSQAFNAKGKDARRIDMKLDEFRSRRPIDIIAKTNPILIIDEPQSVLGPTTLSSIKKFESLMTIGYSATHKIPFNMVYRLDAMEAYNKKLVKKIAVKGITVSGSSGTDGYMYLQNINLSKDKNPTATLEFNIKGATGIKKATRIVNEGFSLYQQSGNLEEYKGYTISRIDGRIGANFVELSNGIKIEVGEVLGSKTDETQIRRIQIRETIESHLERERQLFYKGIKVLSLFFIDEVAKYKDYSEVDEKGIYAHMFEEEYNRIFEHYVGELGDDEYIKFLKTIEAGKTHAGYFSIDKKSGRSINSELKRGSTSSDDIDAYDLIMKNKERLLDRKEPVRFIFSHSALKEGWDNPNVFQICTLKESDATVRKRQEIGRGLRLSVNQNGDRMDASVLGEDVHNINTLTVIANESYQTFATALQNELADIITDRPKEVNVELFEGKVITTEAGDAQTIDKALAKKLYNHFVRQDYVDDSGALTDKYYEDKKAENLSLPEEVKDCCESIVKIIDTIYDIKGMMPEDARQNNVDIKVKAGALDKQEFLALWKKINVKSIYAVDFEGQELIDKAIEALNSKLEVSKIYVKITEGSMKSIDSKQALVEGSAFETKPSQSKMEVISSKGTSIKYDLVGKLVDETGLTRECIVKILTGIEKCVFEQFKQNPEEFIIKSARLINEQKATLVVQHIAYSKIDGEEGVYSTDIFTEPTLKGKLGINTMVATKSIYDHLLYDSNGERDFATQLEESQDVVVYVKLPKGFYISTPVGKYNPDWAIAFNKEHIKHIYFIAETKGSMETLELREIESAKIKCARKHFAAISNEEVQYDVVSNYRELMNKVMR